MKLLFDENISFRLVNKIIDVFPEAKQVRALGLDSTNDSDIWAYAKNNGFTIVTFDADFLDMAQVKGIPPKIIWLRTGNTTTEAIAKLLMRHSNIIQSFVEDDEYKDNICLEID